MNDIKFYGLFYIVPILFKDLLLYINNFVIFKDR